MYYNVDDDVNVDDDHDDDGADADDDDDDDDDVRACAVELHMSISQEPFCGNVQEQCCTPILRHPFCASLRNRNAHGRLTRAILYANLQGKWPRSQRFVRACAVEMHMNISQEPFCIKIYRENGRGHLRGQRFVRACAIEMHMDISQEPFCMEIYRENAKRDGYHLDWTPGLNCYRKNSSVWPHCLGKEKNIQNLPYKKIVPKQCGGGKRIM